MMSFRFNPISWSFFKHTGMALLLATSWLLSLEPSFAQGGGSKPNVEERLSLFTGAGTYQYPIDVPAGTGEMQPGLALTYNSQARWGRLGYGWSISGLGMICRSTQKGVPTYGIESGTGHSLDTFIWNGQELVMDANDDFHTKTESFNRIENTNGYQADSYWVITGRDGTQFFYGQTDDSRIDAVFATGDSRIGQGHVRCWALSKIKDTHGNYLTVTYDEDTTDGDYYPNTVTYTYNDAGSISAYRTVTFSWATRTDVRESYKEGARVKVDQRLDEIEMKISGTLTHKYGLTYSYGGSGGKSLLTEITEYGSDGTSTLEPTKFEYKNPTQGFDTEQDWGAGQDFHLRNISTSAFYTQKNLVDINGDGRPDDIYRDDTGNYLVRRNTGSGFGPEEDWGTGQDSYLRNGGSAYTSKDLIDINGDGRADDVYRNGSGSYQVRLNTGSGFAAMQSWGTGQDSYIRNGVSTYTKKDLIDMNGDGQPDDVFRVGTITYQVRLNTGSGFDPTIQNWGSGQNVALSSTGSSGSNTYTRKNMIDINGDGLPDDVFRNGSVSYQVRLNTGSGFAARQFWGTGQSSYLRYGKSNNTLKDLIDINGDGLPDDVYRYSSGNYEVRLNTGSGFAAMQSWGTGLVGNISQSTHKSLIDINGDGLVDDVHRYHTENYEVRLNSNAGRDLLEKVTLPAGGSIAYGYSSSTQFDNKDLAGKERLPFSMWLVTSVTTDDGLGQQSTDTYSYKGGMYCRPTCEFRGFREITETDPSSAYTVTTFRQEDGVWGKVAGTDHYDSSDNRLQASSSTYAVIDQGDGVLWPRLENEASFQYDGAAVPVVTGTAFTYDAYANVTTASLHELTFTATPTVAVTAQTQGMIDTPVIMGGAVGNCDLRACETQWSVVSGPGSVAFADAAAVATTATFDATGTYVLRLTATNSGGRAASDDVTVAITDNLFPGPVLLDDFDDGVLDPAWVVTLGSGTTGWTYTESGTQLEVEVTDILNGSYVYLNRDLPAPINGTFRAIWDVAWETSALGAGAMYFTLYADDGSKIAYSTISDASTSSDAPVVHVYAYPDSGAWGGALATTGTSVGSGSLEVVRDSANLVTMRWNGVILASKINTKPLDKVKIEFVKMNSWGTTWFVDLVKVIGDTHLPPVVSAGLSSGYSGSVNTPITLSGSATDDGLPTPATLTSMWSVVDGPGVATFSNVHALNSTVSLDQPGTYTLRLTTTDGEYPVHDDTTVEVAYPNGESPVYGNTTLEAAFTTSPESARTTVEYINDTTAWILGLPKHSYTEGFNASSVWEKRRESWSYYDNLAYGSVSVGNATQAEAWLDTTGLRVTTTAGYDTYGNAVWGKDANANDTPGGPTNINGHTADTIYDSTYQTYAVSQTNAVSQTATTAYDSLMRPLSVTDANLQTTTTEYDVFSRPIKTIGPNDTSALPTVATTYFEDGIAPEYTLTQVREAHGQAGTRDSYTFVDGLGGTIQSKSQGAVAGEWITIDRFSDPVTRTSSATIPYITTAVETTRDPNQNQIVTTADAAGRTITVTSTDGTSVTSTYDRGTTTVTNALNQSKTTVTDAFGRVASVTQNDGTQDIVTSYKYHTATGELLEITDARGNLITNAYDSLGRSISMADPDLGTWSYTYDDNGNMLTQTDARGKITSMTYDALGRTVQKDTDASDNLTYTYVYGTDPLQFNVGHLVSTTGTDNGSSSTIFTRSFVYDNLGRATSTTLSMDGNSWASSSTYDALGRVLTTTLPDNEVITNTYDNRGSVVRVVGTDVYLDDAVYLTTGALDHADYGNTTTVTYSYDNSGATPSYRLTNTVVSGGTVAMNLGYTYDAIGNIKTLTDTVAGKDQTFSYDGINRLTNATGVYGTKIYTFDKAGNILTKDGNSYSYDTTRNRLNSDGTWTYSYDLNGNITSRTDGSTTQTFTYDSMNRLIDFDHGSNDGQYVYGDGEARLKKVDNGKTTYYVSGAYEEEIGAAAPPALDLDSLTMSSYGGSSQDVASSSHEFQDGGTTLRIYGNSWKAFTVNYAVTANTIIELDYKSDGTQPEIGGVGLDTDLGLSTDRVWQLYGSQTWGIQTYHNYVSGWTHYTIPVGQTLSAGTYAYLVLTNDHDVGSGSNVFFRNVQIYESNGPATTDVVKRYGGYAIRDSEGLKYRYSDHLGSSARMADASGNEVRAIWHAPFGAQAASTGTAKVKYKYTGKEQDESGLYYYGARYYDPAVGRFMSADSVIPSVYDSQALNRYAYVRNNPIRLVDPDGHFFKEWLFPHAYYSDPNYESISGETVNIPVGLFQVPTSFDLGFALDVAEAAHEALVRNARRSPSSGYQHKSENYSGQNSNGSASDIGTDGGGASPTHSNPQIDLDYLNNAGSWGSLVNANPAPSIRAAAPTPLQKYAAYQSTNHAPNSSSGGDAIAGAKAYYNHPIHGVNGSASPKVPTWVRGWRQDRLYQSRRLKYGGKWINGEVVGGFTSLSRYRHHRKRSNNRRKILLRKAGYNLGFRNRGWVNAWKLYKKGIKPPKRKYGRENPANTWYNHSR